jgi:hypothetical protein
MGTMTQIEKWEHLKRESLSSKEENWVQYLKTSNQNFHCVPRPQNKKINQHLLKQITFYKALDHDFEPQKLHQKKGKCQTR